MRQNLASVLQAVKETEKLSLEEFAQRLEISRTALREYLKGSGDPNLGTIEHIAGQLGIDPRFLLFSDIPPERMRTVILLYGSLRRVAELPEGRRRMLAGLVFRMMSLGEEG